MNTHIDEDMPRLRPLVDRWMSELMADRVRIQGLFAKHGSPLHLLNSAPFVRNYQEYVAVLERHGLAHLVCFARKANKSIAFVEAARDAGFGVDTASYRELKGCLDAGVDPAKLVCTAAVKSEALMRLAIAHDVLVVLDNMDEVKLAERLAADMAKRLKVGVRVSGFYFKGKKCYSRFGFDIDHVMPLFDGPLKGGMLDYEGLHFHLNGYSVSERAEATAALIGMTDVLKEKGVATQFIDVGGGLLMNYLEDGDEWEHFKRELVAAQKGEREPLTFGNDGLGLRWEDWEIRGKLQTYPYYNTWSRGDFLEAVLSYPTALGKPGKLLRERGMELRLEPGRSLLDQCGMTVARVAFRKMDSRGDLLVGLEMNGSQCRSASADFLLDPILIRVGPFGFAQGKKLESSKVYKGGEIPRGENLSDGKFEISKEENCAVDEDVSGYLVGAYCLEMDLILKRKVVFGCMPEVGDVVCFVNTAGYLMHFYERDAHLLGFGVNVDVTE